MPKVLPGEVLVKVAAVGVNRMDLLQKAGKYPPPPGGSEILGPEAAGLVVEGSAFPKGTPVACLLTGGGYAEYVAVDPGLCFQIPKNLTLQQGACIPENWITAYQLLKEVAGLSDFPSNGGRPSEMKYALVYAAASGVGTALLQLFREFLPQVKVLAVCGSPEKIDYAKSLGAAVGLNYKQLGEGLAEEVLRHTDGMGVDIALDCVGASLFPQTLKTLKTDGTWILYGALGGLRVDLSLGVLLQKRLRVLCSTLRDRKIKYKKGLVQGFVAEVLPGFEAGRMQVVIDSEFPWEEAEEAHSRMAAGLNKGKIILVVNPKP